MSERLNKGSKVPVSAKAEPGRASAEMKPKKAAAHRQVIQDAAKYNQSTVQQDKISTSLLEQRGLHLMMNAGFALGFQMKYPMS